MQQKYLSMMDQEKKYLSDILLAIIHIEEFVEDIKSFNSYDNDLKTQSAVERQLGIIGEAVNSFEKISGANSLINARRIIGFRNRLIHAYDSIDNSIVWVIIKKYLPGLKNEVNKIIM